MDDKNVKPIYSELQGYLSQAQPLDKVAYVRDQSIWEQYNNTVDELNNTTGKDYNKFKITNIARNVNNGDLYINNSEYRSKLNGLIMRLYGEYFADERQPFSGGPDTIVNQSQTQSVHIAMIIEFQSHLDKKLYGSDLNEKEKSFLEKIKASLPTVKSATELISLVISIAKTLNISIDQVAKLFGL